VAQSWLGALQGAVPAHRLATSAGDLSTFASDGLTAYAEMPGAVLLARSEQEVVEAVRICHRFGVPFVARGSGTSLSGASVPEPGGLVIALNRLQRIEIDAPRRLATVEPGAWNLDVSKAASGHGLYYAPDPSSQQICSIGGNIAFNAGGAHCLKYGTTLNHVLGLRVVLPDGTVEELGGESLESVGPGLTALFSASEGLLGIVLQATVRLLPKPERIRTVLAAYPTLARAGDAVAAVVAAGLLPAAMEVMDALAIEAAEAAVHPGYPADAGGLVIVELDGEADVVEAEWEVLQRVLEASGATSIRIPRDPRERAEIWRGRKSAFSAVGRLSPDFIVNDGVVPRARLPEALSDIEALSARYGLRIANVFHAGDGNLHPLILYDGRVPGEHERAEVLSGEILDLCIRVGGSITGEHGVGLEKRGHFAKMYAAADIDAMRRIRLAVDPLELANPGKVLPIGPVAEADVRPAAGALADGGPAPGAMDPEVLRPTTIDEVREAVATHPRLLPRGGGTKTALSAPYATDVAVLDLSGLAGIVEYDPSEFVLTALAGTRIAEIERLLAAQGQCLPFDPLLVHAGATLGGTVAAGISGPGRYRRGGVRDFVLGARFVDGRGELVRSRGRVVKNVAGFDLPRLLTGSCGRLAALVEVSVKVFPRPEAHGTLVVRRGLADALEAIRDLTLSPFDIDAIDLVPAGAADGPAEVLVRLAGPAAILEARLERLRAHLGGGELLADDAAAWADVTDLRMTPDGWTLAWAPVTPAGVPALEAALAATGTTRRYSAGGQVAWVAGPDPEAVSSILASRGLAGLRVLGAPGADPVVGRPVIGELGRRVQAALDPAGRFRGA
jgi:glycolate oxidase